MRKLAPVLIVLALAAVAQAAEGHGAEAEVSPSVFTGTLAQSFAAIIVFLILLALLYKMAWGPILKGLQEREGRIKQDLEQAQDSARQADATLREYRAKLAEAQEHARQVIDKGRADAERIATQLKEETQSEITQMRQRAQSEIRAAKEEALAAIYAQTAHLATDVAGRILRRELKPDDQGRLVQESLAELEKAGRS